MLFHILLVVLAVCWYTSVEEKKPSTYESIERMPVVKEKSVENPKEGQLIRTKEGVKYYSDGNWYLLRKKAILKRRA